eukprot:538636_1
MATSLIAITEAKPAETSEGHIDHADSIRSIVDPDKPPVTRIESEDQKEDPAYMDRSQSNSMVFKRAHTVMLTSEEMQWFEDDYVKLEPLGEPGTFGMAFKCHKKGASSQLYAVKQINKAKFYFNETKGVLQNMKNEIQIMNTLSDHGNICKLHDTYEDRNYIYLILDFLSGGELYGKIEEFEELEERHAQDITKQILSAIDYMQQHLVAHLDLKPDNILFVSGSWPDARIKIIDFGEARVLTDEQERLDQKIGTPYYMAPEIIREVPYLPFPADMWSVGVIIFCMLFGFVPFHAEEEEQIFENIKKGFKNEIIDGYGAFFPKDIPISEDAMDIISGLLTSDPSQRLTCDECLSHRWIRGDLSKQKRQSSRLSLPFSKQQKRQSMRKLFLVKEDPITIINEEEDAGGLTDDFVHICAPQNGIIKKGYLKKEGKLFKSWKQRWFLLQNNGCVSYYGNHRDLSKPIATFSIIDANIIKSSKVQHGIILCTLQRNWKFVCPSEKSRNEWCAAFEAASRPQIENKKKHTLQVGTAAFSKLQKSLHETEYAISPEQLNRDEETTKRIESQINKKLIVMMNEREIPQNAREKMLQLDQTRKIQMIQQHLSNKINNKNTHLNHYKGTKSLHIPTIKAAPAKNRPASSSLAVQSKTMQKKRKTAQESMFGERHNLIVMALINACKHRIKVMRNDGEIVSCVDKVFEEHKDDDEEEEEEEEEAPLRRARTDVVFERDTTFEMSRSTSVIRSNSSNKYVCRSDNTISFATLVQCIQYMLKEEWQEEHTQLLYASLLKYISLNHKAKIFSIGIDRRTRHYFLKTFNDCFIGNEAVNWLCKAKFVKNTADKRERAKDLGNSFYTKGFIKHVAAQHKFKDEKLWYQIDDALIDKRCLMENNSMQQTPKKSSNSNSSSNSNGSKSSYME